jgi:hypothetical protein
MLAGGHDQNFGVETTVPVWSASAESFVVKIPRSRCDNPWFRRDVPTEKVRKDTTEKLS